MKEEEMEQNRHTSCEQRVLIFKKRKALFMWARNPDQRRTMRYRDERERNVHSPLFLMMIHSLYTTFKSSLSILIRHLFLFLFWMMVQFTQVYKKKNSIVACVKGVRYFHQNSREIHPQPMIFVTLDKSGCDFSRNPAWTPYISQYYTIRLELEESNVRRQ